jgi:hypothetical protein
MALDSTYTLVRDAPPPLEWEAYAGALAREFALLLDSGDCVERSYQAFLESHPSLLPWAYGTFGGGHHGLIHGVVITQPRLPALAGKQPDFMMITRDTGSVYAVLVEIESPCKGWFTRQGRPTKHLTQAINQLREWKAWFEQSANAVKFQEEYQVPFSFDHRRFEQRYVLIYGRRHELLESGFAHMRSHHQAPDERFMSYDHLKPDENLRDAVTARVDGKGYRAVSVPPTLRLGPFQADDLVAVRGKETAVRANPLMPAERAAFLKSRFPYWDKWSRTGGGIRNMADVE